MRNATLEALEPAVEREGWKIILLSQLHPLFPTSLLNYLYGLTTIRFRTCILWVAIGQAPGAVPLRLLRDAGAAGAESRPREEQPPSHRILDLGGGLLFSVVILMMLGRIALRLLREAEEATREQNAANTLERVHSDELAVQKR
jgi:uncharacterized membrane protein YdjX (TVP38/TMEM64 family)